MKTGKNFTLVELLIILIVIVLLAGLAFPAYSHVRRNALRALCAGNLKQLGFALNVYAKDSNHHLPHCAGYGLAYRGPSIRSVLLARKGVSKKMFHCPADSTYFPVRHSSYQWNAMANGKRLDERSSTLSGQPRSMPVLFDIGNFHGASGKISSRNYLYLPSTIRNEMFLSGK